MIDGHPQRSAGFGWGRARLYIICIGPLKMKFSLAYMNNKIEELSFLINENKLRVLLAIYRCTKDVCACNLVDNLGMPKNLLSYHIKTLREAIEIFEKIILQTIHLRVTMLQVKLVNHKGAAAYFLNEQEMLPILPEELRNDLDKNFNLFFTDVRNLAIFNNVMGNGYYRFALKWLFEKRNVNGLKEQLLKIQEILIRINPCRLTPPSPLCPASLFRTLARWAANGASTARSARSMR